VIAEMTSESSRIFQENRSIAFCSGALSMMISMNSPPRGAGPITRRTQSCGSEIASNAPRMAVNQRMSRVSISRWMVGGMSETASMRRCVPIFMATARAPTLSRIWRASSSGTMPLGAASRTSAAVRAEASRSLSQFSRKFAIEGT
jgi:hypothetical protein